MTQVVDQGQSRKSLGAIEVRSIDYVPQSERHGKVWAQGPFWFLGNFQFFTIAIGFIGPALFKLDLFNTVVASALGIGFGTLFMAFHASQGPTLGLPQMIQSRAQFGYRGVIVPLVATLFTFVGFNIVDQILIGQGVHGIFGISVVVASLTVTVAGTLLAVYGHDWLHRVFKVLFWASVPFAVVLTLAIIFGGAGGKPATGLSFSWLGYIAQFAAAASYNITYSPYVSDYSRYLPRNTDPRKIVIAVYVGAGLAAVWLISVGAWLAARLTETDPLVALQVAGNNVFGGLGTILAILSVLALTATMGLNAYSAMLTVVTGIDAVKKVRPTRRLRVLTIIVLAVSWALIAFSLGGNAVNTLNNTLLLMLALLVPWTSINLVDYFFVRRGHYAITDLFTPRGIYGAWGWRGLVAYFVGLVLELPFIYVSFFVGPFAKTIGTDVSFVVGLAVSSILYWILSRSMDVASEEPAIARSEEELAAAELIDVRAN